MRIIGKWQILALLLFNALTLNACSSAPAENSNANPKNDALQKNENSQIQMVKTGNSPVMEKLIEAQKGGKAVFVVVTDDAAENKENALSIANDAKTVYNNAIIVEMNRDNPDNAQLVKEWKISGARLPLLLVVSTKGLLTGGYTLRDATPQNLAELVPSPNLERVYEAINNKKHAIIVFTKKSFTDRIETIKASKEAVLELKGEAIFVEVDMDDKTESGFMKQLRVNSLTANASVTIVVNTQGQIAGTATAIPNTKKLVEAAKTPVKNGCGADCGPKGCN